MIHDLIPVLYPQYFDDHGGRKFLTETLSNLSPHQWFFANSTATKTDMCNFSPRLDPKRVIVTPLAAAAHFRPCADAAEIEAVRRRLGIPEGPYFLSVCTLEPRKNLQQVVRCFRRLRHEPQLADTSLILAGRKGWLCNPLLRDLEAATGAKERILVTGFVPDADLPALYSGALAFVYPSLYEGFGLPVLEAMQCGSPVITSNNSSMPEVVGSAGLLVDARDADALCQAMLRLRTDATLRLSLKNAGFQQAKQFSWERCAQATVAGYELALADVH